MIDWKEDWPDHWQVKVRRIWVIDDDCKGPWTFEILVNGKRKYEYKEHDGDTGSWYFGSPGSAMRYGEKAAMALWRRDLALVNKRIEDDRVQRMRNTWNYIARLAKERTVPPGGDMSEFGRAVAKSGKIDWKKAAQIEWED
jgi:hypothetical protein